MTKRKTFPLTINVPESFFKKCAEYIADELYNEHDVTDIKTKDILATPSFSNDMVKQLTGYLKDMVDDLELYYVFTTNRAYYDIEKHFAPEIKAANSAELKEEKELEQTKPLTVSLNGKNRKQVKAQLKQLGLIVQE